MMYQIKNLENNMATVKFKPIGITDVSVRRILESGNCDALALYVAYYEISVWQETHKVYATESFMRKRMNLGQVRFRNAKKVLEQLEIVKLHNGGRNKKSYIEIFHLADSSVESELPIQHSSVDNSPSINSSVNIEPQVLSTLSKVLSSKSKVLEEEVKERFDKFRLLYKKRLKGKTKGLDTEYNNFKKKCPKENNVESIRAIELLLGKYYKELKSKEDSGDLDAYKYVPMFSKYINQRLWEIYED